MTFGYENSPHPSIHWQKRTTLNGSCLHMLFRYLSSNRHDFDPFFFEIATQITKQAKHINQLLGQIYDCSDSKGYILPYSFKV
jgi:hypothetical protein